MNIHKGKRIAIERLQASRAGWYDGYRAESDESAWEGLDPAADSDEWEW